MKSMYSRIWLFPGGDSYKEPTCQCRRSGFETWVRFLGWKDPLEEDMATHSSILAWRTPWTEEPGGLQSMGSQRVGHDQSNLAQYIYSRKAEIMSSKRDDSDQKGLGMSGIGEAWGTECWAKEVAPCGNITQGTEGPTGWSLERFTADGLCLWWTDR